MNAGFAGPKYFVSRGKSAQTVFPAFTPGGEVHLLTLSLSFVF